MPRPIPPDQRRVAEEAVRHGLVAPIVMEAAAREWTAGEDGESFPDYLVRRAVLRRDQADGLAAAVEAEAPGGAPGPDGAKTGERTPPPSEIVQGYRILERLGRGGMGSVYRAEQIGMNRTVALKILRRPLSRDEQQVERLRREARLVGSLEHPNIVRGLDVGQSGPYHYFAMEFVEGETLRDRLKKRGAMPEAEVLRILEQVCQALDHAHARGVIHRDVKPGNIILTSEGVPKLTDYGLAKGPADFALTQSGVTIGTPQYISPEQARDPARVDVQTDLYSLGATAYHMVTGVPPHTSETLAGLLTKVLYEKPRTARQVNPRVSAGASFLVEKLMAKQKKHRYRTPRDVLRDLGSLSAGRSIVPRDWAGDFEVHELRRRLRRWVVAGASLLVLAAGALAFMQHKAALERESNRRAAAERSLSTILDGERPRTEAGWRDRLRALDEFLAFPENAATPSEARARDRRERARLHLEAWGEADRARAFARKSAEQDDFLDAIRILEERIALLEQDPQTGEIPAGDLRRKALEFRQEGRDRAEERRREAMAQVRRIPVRAGAAEQVAVRLRDLRGLLLGRYVDSEADAAVRAVDDVLENIAAAGISIEHSYLAGYRKERERLLAQQQFATLWGMLDSARERIHQDQDLQGNLNLLPEPAAGDLRGRIQAELDEIRERNVKAVETAIVTAGTRESEDRFEEAKRVLDDVYQRSIPELQEQIAAVRERLVERHEATVRARRDRAGELLRKVIEDLDRRDVLGAGKRLDSLATELEREPPGSPVKEAVEAARLLLGHVEKEVFDPVRALIRSGKALERGLRFLTGDRIHHDRVLNVRLEETPTGDVVVFDAPGQRGLREPLHALASDLLFAYADLPPRGTTLRKAFARGTLVIAEGEDWSRGEIEGAMSLILLARDGVEGEAGIDRIGPAVEALRARGSEIIEDKIRAEKNQEQIAADYLRDVEAALASDNPKKAQDTIDLLLKAPLSGTRVVRENRALLLSYRETAGQRMSDLELLALWPRWRVASKAGGTTREPLTQADCEFDSEDQAGAFVPREDGGQRLFRIQLPLPGAPEGTVGGRLVYVEPEPLRDAPPDGVLPSTFDSPLTLECPFKPTRYMGISFRVLFADPLYFQVSVVGNHLGIATDDGRRESGRGVYVYQDQEWRTPDAFFPDVYRHAYVKETYLDRGEDPQAARTPPIHGQEGIRYFQFEKDRWYQVRIVLDKGHLTLWVDGRQIWDAPLRNKYFRDDPPRIRIATFTPLVLDDLALFGIVDRPYLRRLLKR